MVANACMHCADPVCMIGCPTGAIHRSMSGGMVVINDDTCIGCGTCANSCPYENISLVQIADKQGMPVVDEATHRPIMKATKCDLCSDQLGGPACVRACPHDALKRVDFREFAH
jgi:Fe-S-cluster-containing dehydrogenase component